MRRIALHFFAACLVGGCLNIAPADAASLRRTSVLHHSQVKLSDLFNGIAPDQDCDLGPAPAPGQSLTISAPQLQAIAQQYGIDWPEMSDLAQATLTRASHTVSRDDIMPLIVDGLKTRGVSDSAAIELTNFSGPTVAAELANNPQLSNIVYDASHGRFSAFFSITSDDATQSFRADGTVSSRVKIVTARTDLPAGQIIEQPDIEVAEVDSRSVPTRAILDPTDIIGQSTRRAVRAHTPLTSEMTSRIDLIEKGSPIILDVSSSGLHLTAAGVALDSGAQGERIHALNPTSRMVVVGQVIDRTRIAVTPGTAPTPADSREMRSAGIRAPKNI
ncbi:flagella basal body P-ring formation protein FlgA [Acetobacter aceti NBRC 14818]|uniref:Flagellar basal body P-ring biosynthesis protein FlgA n=1 Tax=Acetobacter aceti NBRC 14818 TaxID=887700 RepID=A0AB33IHW7_ACEAC|nr:flagellar basal body P-ring formation chaperone FlgA [Acetobacter aceti]TCS29645.1 flagella basal body P-ring formation protein FlgA [Acetobacter aceti NBRC 14818]BCK77144.1 flagellar basal body P-ring biosynthesis protein FlgA [Acetobacter aceti NBRC 14818]GAN57847.1 flagellar basal body P-ring biosynthesis protein FlgA [Acetobacter aceti NBRC 14818]